MLAKRLRIALDRKGMKQSVLAYRVGVDRSYISIYLSGKYKPSAEIHNKIAEVLGVSSAWLSGFDVPMLETPEATEPVVADPVPKGNDNFALIFAARGMIFGIGMGLVLMRKK